MKYSMTALILALFAVGSAGAFAQPGQETEDPSMQQAPQGMDIQGKDFSELDKDGDGQLTQSEATEAGLEPVAFEALDENADDVVSEQEFEQAKQGGGAR